VSLAGLAQFLGAQAVYVQPEELASEGEVVVYWELVRRLGVDGFRVAAGFGDIPFTPEQEARSVEFLIESAQLVILVNSPFTHPDIRDDVYFEHLLGLLGLRAVFLWYDEIIPPGGNVARALDEKCPELRHLGNIYLKREIPWLSKRVFQHPAGTTSMIDQRSRELGGPRVDAAKEARRLGRTRDPTQVRSYPRPRR
jgi:hypothetical protein